MIDQKLQEFQNFTKDRILMSWICGALGAWFYTFLVCEREFLPDPRCNREKNLEWNFNNAFAVSNSPYTHGHGHDDHEHSPAYGHLRSFLTFKYPNATDFEMTILLRLLEVKIALTTSYINELRSFSDIFAFFKTLDLESIDNTPLPSSVDLDTWRHIKTHKEWIFFKDNSIQWKQKLNVAFPKEKRWIPRLLCLYKKTQQWLVNPDRETRQRIINRVENFNLQTPLYEYEDEVKILTENNFHTVDMYELVFNKNVSVVTDIFPDFEFTDKHQLLLDTAFNDQNYILKLFDLDHTMNLKLDEPPRVMMDIYDNSDHVNKLKTLVNLYKRTYEI
jgi:hypothetical protein